MTGKEISEIREKTDLSQEDLARSIGVSPQTLKMWEASQDDFPALACAVLTKWQTLLNNLADVELDLVGWFQMKNQALSGRSPKEVVSQGPDGLEAVFNLCGRMAYGIPT